MRVALYYPWIYLTSGAERIILELSGRSRHSWTLFTSHFAPEQTFQVFEKPDSTVVTMSPYRLGDHPNISAGIATVTAAPEAVKMFKEIIVNQWDRASKAEKGAKLIEDILARTPV